MLFGAQVKARPLIFVRAISPFNAASVHAFIHAVKEGVDKAKAPQ